MGKFDNFDYAGYLRLSLDGYDKAKNYYRTQKNHFMKMLKETNKEILQQNGQKILERLTQEINIEFETENIQEKTQEFYDKIEEMVYKYLNSTSGGQILKSELNKIKNDSQKREQILSLEAKKQSEKIKNIIEKDLSKRQLSALKVNINKIYGDIYGVRANSASTGAGYGMFRRALIKEMTGEKYYLSSHSKGGYTKILSGYYIETAIANVFKKWAENTNIKVAQVGSSGGKTDIAIGIGNIEKQLEELEKLAINSISDDDLGPTLLNSKVFGIQSKSWNIPENLISGRNNNYTKGFMSIGNHKNLWDMLRVSDTTISPYRGWHYNVFQISRHMLTAIGPANVLYRLSGNDLKWTYELIDELVQKKYYLAFWFTHDKANKRFEYPATTELAWQKVDNRKNYAKNS